MKAREDLANITQQIGPVSNAGYLREIGVLKKAVAENASDIVGFNYVIFNDGVCYAYYSANPPLIGMSNPTPVQYPLGLAVFSDFKITYQKAVDLFHSGNWGSGFTSISLSKPLYPDVNDPYWYFISDLGTHVTVNANTGEVKSQN
jgi:hypothetical protein